MFADKVGMNIVFHNSVDGKVTLDLVETPINEAFNLVLSIAGLNYYKQGNTMIIMAKGSADNAAFSKQEMMVFPVNYVSADSIANFLNKNVFSMKKAGMSGTEAATVNSATNELIVFGMPSDAAIVEKVIEQFDKEPYTKTFAVNHTTPAEMATMICDLLLPARGMGSSGGSGKGARREVPAGAPGMSTGGAAGIITGAAASSGGDELKLGEGIIACSLSGSASGSVAPFDVQNLSIAYFPQRGTITLMGGSEAQARMIENFIKTNDIKQPQAYLEVSIVELNEAGSKEFQNQWNLGSKHWQANFDGTSFSGGRPGGTAWTAKNEYIWDSGDQTGRPIANRDDDGNVTWTIPNQIYRTIMQQVPSVHINWMMNYLVQNNKGRVLANPKILITNGQESVIDLTSDYVEKVTAEFLSSASNGSSTVGTTQRDYTIGDDLGIKVSLMPFISPEGYVTLNIQPKYSTIAEQIYATNNSGTNELAATLLSRRDLDLKNVRIKDGETLVIGGMLQEVETKSVNKIPLLGDLPLVGAAFRSSSTKRTKSELVIMITPNIIKDGEGAIADSI
jgi:type II secretory pathway component GspD/PulD (secretin)